MSLFIQGQCPEHCLECHNALGLLGTTLGHQDRFQQYLIFFQVFDICLVFFHYRLRAI